MVSLIKKLFKPTDKQEVEYYCIYNENNGCYERACGFCSIKSECQWCCGAECWSCEGLMIKRGERIGDTRDNNQNGKGSC